MTSRRLFLAVLREGALIGDLCEDYYQKGKDKGQLRCLQGVSGMHLTLSKFTATCILGCEGYRKSQDSQRMSGTSPVFIFLIATFCSFSFSISSD